MREQRAIKFRAWHKKHGMIYPDEYFTLQDAITGNLDFFGSPAKDFNIADFVFMQYTGLQDSQGQEIYEDDILELNGATAKVVFWGKPPEFGLDYYHNEDEWCEDWNLSDDSELMKIIGNVHDIGHLLASPQE